MKKWAIYSLIEDNSIEIGKSSWIVGEDKETFTNDEWLFAKQVIGELLTKSCPVLTVPQ